MSEYDLEKSASKSAIGTKAKVPNGVVNRNYLMSIIMDQYNITESDLDMDPSVIRSKIRDIRIEALIESGGVTTDA